MSQSRTIAGRFVLGKSGNPGGKKAADPVVKAILLAACPAAAQKLSELVSGDDQRLALDAAKTILERVYGKPTQPIEGSGSLQLIIVSAIPGAPYSEPDK